MRPKTQDEIESVFRNNVGTTLIRCLLSCLLGTVGLVHRIHKLQCRIVAELAPSGLKEQNRPFSDG
jgi:hypothetical protein